MAADTRARASRRPSAVVALLAVALVALVAWSLTIGPYDLTAGDVVASALRAVGIGDGQRTPTAQTVLLVIRLPRVLLAALVGAALAASGAAYQGLFRNPLVSPDILGVSSGAGVGAALGLLLGAPTLVVHLMSFGCGVAAVALVAGIARALSGNGNALVLMMLAGMVISSVFSALTSLLKYIADPDDKLPAITYWLMGSFARAGAGAGAATMAAVLLVAGGTLLLMRWRLNAMSFGEDEARSMGVDVRCTRGVVVLASTLLTSVAVCLCGAIGWVGLIVPHMGRLAVGPNFRSLLPVSLLGGACFMVLVDDLARCLSELPVGVITALLGAPLFVLMLLRGRRDWL